MGSLSLLQERILFGEISLREKDKYYHVITNTWDLKNNTKEKPAQEYRTDSVGRDKIKGGLETWELRGTTYYVRNAWPSGMYLCSPGKHSHYFVVTLFRSCCGAFKWSTET